MMGEVLGNFGVLSWDWELRGSGSSSRFLYRWLLIKREWWLYSVYLSSLCSFCWVLPVRGAGPRRYVRPTKFDRRQLRSLEWLPATVTRKRIATPSCMTDLRWSSACGVPRLPKVSSDASLLIDAPHLSVWTPAYVDSRFVTVGP